jgi:integrase
MAKYSVRDTTIHNIRNNKLHIHKRRDGKSDNWIGRTYISGKQIQESSRTSKLSDAKRILGKWYDELVVKNKYGLVIHDNNVQDSIVEFMKYNEKTTSIGLVTKKGYRDHFNMIVQFKDLMKLKMNAVKETDIESFISWRINRAKKQGKVLRGKTIEGNLTALAKFFNWSVKNGLRKDKLGNLKKLLSVKLRKQKTERAGFSYEQYKHLLQVSRERIKSGNTVALRFSRERLHQFIIFMVGTGLRVDECLNLDWLDVSAKDRTKKIDDKSGVLDLNDNERYYLFINVRISKTGERECKSVASAYFAYMKLLKLYRDHGRKTTGKIFGVKSFREGINALLLSANLKTEKRGDRVVKRDSKSLRNTFIQFMLDKGVASIRVALNCGTSSKMIDQHYMANSQIEDYLDSWLKTKISGNQKLKVV